MPRVFVTGDSKQWRSVGAMWTFERTIDFDRFSRQTSRFRFRFFWLPKYGHYTGLTKKVLTVAFSGFSPATVADFGHYSRHFSHRKRRL